MKQTTSFKSLLLKNIFGFALVIFVMVTTIIITKADQLENNKLEQNTLLWANFLAQKSIPFLNDDIDKANLDLNKALKELIITSFINRIHIYQHNADGSNDFFTSYNKNHNFPAIKDKMNKIAKLSTFNYQDDYLELIIEINHKQKKLGYLYIQSSFGEKHNLLKSLIITSFIVAIMIIALSIIIALRLYNKITFPIKDITEDIGQASFSNKDQSKLHVQPYRELDILAKNINILLNRTVKSISKLEDDKQYALSQNNELKDRVSSRTDALKESNQELLSTLEKLHQFQGQLVETEKMASLGDMVAGIAHEINTPIGLGVTASSLLSDKHREIKQAFEGKTLKSSQLNKFLTDSEENIDIIFRNLERAAKLISSFKKVAVDQSSAESRTFNVLELLEEVLLTLSAKLKSVQVNVSLNCPKGLCVTSKPGPINQILINLILNSIYHAFEGRDNGEITVNVMNLSDQLHITYSDNGVGIDEKIKSKIFDPFTTTKRGSGGSGLGMHLVYNLVTQALDGNIQVESEAGQGVYFDITFPVSITSDQ